LVPRINVETVLNLDFYWNKCNLYIEIEISDHAREDNFCCDKKAILFNNSISQ
jgi:hypothetical protein